MRGPVMERLMARVERSADGCWNWTGGKASGYGAIYDNGKIRRTHRVAYENLVGPIPEGLTIDHLCRNKACCNPAHLEPVTQAVNVERHHTYLYNNVRKTCYFGHEFPDDEPYEGAWRRPCPACQKRKVAS